MTLLTSALSGAGIFVSILFMAFSAGPARVPGWRLKQLDYFMWGDGILGILLLAWGIRWIWQGKLVWGSVIALSPMLLGFLLFWLFIALG